MGSGLSLMGLGWTHEAKVVVEARTHEAEAKADFFDLEAETKPWGLTSLRVAFVLNRNGSIISIFLIFWQFVQKQALNI